MASPPPLAESVNYYERLYTTGQRDDALAKSIRAELSKGRVHSPEAAQMLVMQTHPGKHGYDLMRQITIGGLYRLGYDRPDFGSAGGLVWEVRVIEKDGGISNVIWISCSSAAVRSLFP